MELSIYQVDAFSSVLFKGNPAAVVPLNEPIDAGLMQAIAAENNLSETAFFYPCDDGFYLRWFTPMVEVPLCGHATLAAAYVLFNELGFEAPEIKFQSLSGALSVRRKDERLELCFPRIDLMSENFSSAFAACFDQEILACYKTTKDANYLILFNDEAAVRNLEVNIPSLKQLGEFGVIVTAQGEGGVDFVSRYFAPSFGIDEDPVTGSIHCALAPFWAERLQKGSLQAEQVSERGGRLECVVEEQCVRISGAARLYLKGSIWV
jgi:PhzF family phenazine biosynthesis protein